MDTQSLMDDEFLSKVHHVIENNLDNENFTVEDLAKSVGLSRSMLHRKLIRLTGKSASEHITEIRISNAKSILENNDTTVSETAYRVGFKSPSYFNKVFKKYFNVSPGEVKKGVLTNDANTLHELNSKIKKHTAFKKIMFNQKTLIYFTIILCFILGFYVMILFLPPEQKSLAVLPLHNLTGQTDNDYFVDGMHESLIGELGQFNAIRVISRTSTLRYRESNMLLKDIAKELGVNTILEGSVIGAGDSVRIVIQMIDVYPKERHILSRDYQDDFRNVLMVQSKVVKDVAERIKIKLTKTEKKRLTLERKVNPETYKAYLRGMYYLNQGTDESFETGMQYLHQAIDIDPGDAFAYAGLALGYSIVGHGQLNAEEAFNRAVSAANKAIQLDSTIDEAYTALSILYLYNALDWPKAKKAFDNAIAHNPNNAIAHAHYAWYYILFNDMDKSIYHAKQAVRIEPFSASYSSWLALLYIYFGEYKEAELWAGKAIDLKDDVSLGYQAMAWINLHHRNYKQAIEYQEKIPVSGDYWKMLRGYTYVKAGQQEKALEIWNDLEQISKEREVNDVYRGMMASYLGFTDKAFYFLNKAVDTKSYPITYINFYPCTESIRSDARYNKLLSKMNLPKYDSQYNDQFISKKYLSLP